MRQDGTCQKPHDASNEGRAAVVVARVDGSWALHGEAVWPRHRAMRAMADAVGMPGHAFEALYGAVSRMPLAFIAISTICCFTAGERPA